MTTRLRRGDRVRHMTDSIEGVVASVLPPERRGAPATVEVQIDRGGVERTAEGFWQRLPDGGRLSA